MEQVPRDLWEDNEFWEAKAALQERQGVFFAEINDISEFDLDAYCEERKHANPWVTLDIGPGLKPSGLNREYKEGSRYVAFEPCLNPWFAMRGAVERMYVDITAQRPDEDITLKDALHIRTGKTGKLVFVGNYSFPDGKASEVFVSNVFDDDTIHADPGKDPKIIAEVFRMLQPGGVCIIQDTAFNMATRLGDMLKGQGFELVFGQNARVAVGDEEAKQLYEEQFAERIRQLGLHYEDHSNLSLLIARKPILAT